MPDTNGSKGGSPIKGEATQQPTGAPGSSDRPEGDSSAEELSVDELEHAAGGAVSPNFLCGNNAECANLSCGTV